MTRRSLATLKAITIKQPWVHAILYEGKDIENRSWRRDFRGWLVIHAAARAAKVVDFPNGRCLPDLSRLPRAAICGVVRVLDVVGYSRSKWYITPSPGTVNYGWVLAEPIALSHPIPCKGWLGLWELPVSLERQLRAQLPAVRLDD